MIKYYGSYLGLKLEQNCPNHTLPLGVSVLQHLELKWLHRTTCYKIFQFPHPQKEVFRALCKPWIRDYIYFDMDGYN